MPCFYIHNVKEKLPQTLAQKTEALKVMDEEETFKQIDTLHSYDPHSANSQGSPSESTPRLLLIDLK